MMVCKVDGATLVQNRDERWFHTEVPPEGTPEHEPQPITLEEYRAGVVERQRQHQPGEPHQYHIECKVCGQPGTLRVLIDPPVSGG